MKILKEALRQKIGRRKTQTILCYQKIKGSIERIRLGSIKKNIGNNFIRNSYEYINRYLKKRLELKAILALFTGNSIAQIISLIAAPILVRLYTPEEFGILVLFITIGQILTIITCLGYEFAIVLPEKTSEAISLVSLCFKISFVFCCSLYFFIFVFKSAIIQIIENEQLYSLLYLIPIYVFLGGIYNILNYFNIRINKFSIIAQSTIIKNSSNAFWQILLGFCRCGVMGLITGQISMNLFGNFRLFIEYRKEKRKQLEIFHEIKLAKKYANFPFFNMPGSLLNVISLNISNILINKLFSLRTVGFFSYSYKYIGFPISLLSTSIGQVYYKQIVEAIRNNTYKRVYKTTVTKLCIIGLCIFSFLFFFIEPIFVFLFGEEWREAGIYARILIPLFFIRFVVSPLSMTMIAFNKQKYIFILQIGLLICSIIPFIIGFFYVINIISYLYLYVIFVFLYNLIYLFVIYYCIYNQHPSS